MLQHEVLKKLTWNNEITNHQYLQFPMHLEQLNSSNAWKNKYKIPSLLDYPTKKGNFREFRVRKWQFSEGSFSSVCSWKTGFEGESKAFLGSWSHLLFNDAMMSAQLDNFTWNMLTVVALAFTILHDEKGRNITTFFNVWNTELWVSKQNRWHTARFEAPVP